MASNYSNYFKLLFYLSRSAYGGQAPPTEGRSACGGQARLRRTSPAYRRQARLRRTSPPTEGRQNRIDWNLVLRNFRIFIRHLKAIFLMYKQCLSLEKNIIDH